MNNNIKPGYLLKVETWENDADNYNTTEFHSKDRSEIEFLVKVAKLFVSSNAWQGPRGYGKADVADVNLDAAIDDIVANHTGNIPNDWSKAFVEQNDAEWFAEYGDNGDFYNDNIYDMIGIWCEGKCYRVMESFTVIHIPEAGIDITDEFK